MADKDDDDYQMMSADDINKAKLIRMTEDNCLAIQHNLRGADVALEGMFSWMLRMLSEGKLIELKYALEHMQMYYSSRS